jgi:hypothetical protein
MPVIDAGYSAPRASHFVTGIPDIRHLRLMLVAIEGCVNCSAVLHAVNLFSSFVSSW